MELADHLPPRIGRIVRLMVRLKYGFLVVSTLVLALTFFFVVVLRYGLQTDLFAYEEWLLPICFWMYFMGSAVGTYEDTQIRADLIESYVTDPTAVWLRKLVVTGLEFLITLAAVYWAVLMIRDEIAAYPFWQQTIALKIPFLVPRLGMLAGFVMMALYSGLHLWVLWQLGVRGLAETRRT